VLAVLSTLVDWKYAGGHHKQKNGRPPTTRRFSDAPMIMIVGREKLGTLQAEQTFSWPVQEIEA